MSRLLFQILFIATYSTSASFGAVISASWASQDQDAAQNWITTLPPQGGDIDSGILDGDILSSFNPNDSPGYQDFLNLIEGMMDATPISSDVGRFGPGLYALVPSDENTESSNPVFTAEVVFGHGTSIPEPSALSGMLIFGFGLLARRKRSAVD